MRADNTLLDLISWKSLMGGTSKEKKMRHDEVESANVDRELMPKLLTKNKGLSGMFN